MTMPRFAGQKPNFPRRPVTVGAALIFLGATICVGTRDRPGIPSPNESPPYRAPLVLLLGSRLVAIDSAQGVVLVTYVSRSDGDKYTGFSYDTGTSFLAADTLGNDRDMFVTGRRDGPLWSPPSFGFRFSRPTAAASVYKRRPAAACWRLQFPYWSVFALILVCFFVVPLARWTRHRRRVLRGQCVHCGYDLRASTDRCPECGAPIVIRA